MSDIVILKDIRALVIASKSELKHSVNSVMVQTYWHIGRIIVEDEQQGQRRAKYGAKQLAQIADTLTQEFGRGFDSRNLRNMRKFYLTYPIWNAVSSKLSWTHYRRLIRLENSESRDWYMSEAIENSWSARALDRQISNLYYERLLSRYSVLSDSQQLFSSKYLPFLPTEEELKQELLRERT